MRLIHWNCQGSFRTKNNELLSLQPNILIISECENPDKLGFGKSTSLAGKYFWYGDNAYRGIGIFSYSDYELRPLNIYNPEFRFIIPFNISRNGQSWTLFAIWAMNNKEFPEARYIGQVWLAINFYKNLLNDSTVLIGDFNSNKIWDHKDRVGNHSDVVDMLENFRISSLYHKQYKLGHGKETKPTFFMHRKNSKPYHIDYCFASEKILSKGFNFAIGDYEDWIDKSDHMPITVDINSM